MSCRCSCDRLRVLRSLMRIIQALQVHLLDRSGKKLNAALAFEGAAPGNDWRSTWCVRGTGVCSPVVARKLLGLGLELLCCY